MSHEIIPVSPELLALIGTEGINALGLPKREIFLLDIVVAGTSFCPIVQELYPTLLPDTVLRMVRQPHNEHDENAIAIYYEEHRIGYVPQELTLVISRLMDAGKEFYARVVQVKKIHEWVRISAKLFMIE